MNKAVLNLIFATKLILEPPPRLKISRWADEYRYLSSESSAQTGKYRSEITPYCREIMDEANNRKVQSEVVMMASQLGKTETINNIVGYFIDQDPAPILVVQPTVEFAESWSKERLDPMLRDTPRLRGRVSEARSRTSNNTIRMKSFPGGNIAIVGANAPSGLAGRPRRVVLLDEVDRFAISAGGEGDPCTLAIRRTSSFWNSVIVMTSTPTIKGVSRIENEFEKTDKRKWYCPCPDCGHYQELKWMQVKWDKKINDDKTKEHFPETAYYECENAQCLSKWDDTKRLRAIKSGQWRATAKFNGKRGYHLNGIACPFPPQSGYKTRLHQMAQEFLDAQKGGIETIKTWTNTFLAETFEEVGERMETSPFLERREDYTPEKLPNDVVLIVVVVDVQGDRLELEAVAVGDAEETWGVEFVKLWGDPEKDEVWTDLKNFHAKKYLRTDGTEIPITCTVIDLGHKPNRVRKFIKTCGLPRVWGVYGTSGKQVALVTARVNKFYRMNSYSVNTTLAKDTIFARLKMKDAGARYMHWHKGYDKEYFEGLTAEEKRVRYSHGFPETFYEKIRARNEPLDLRVYFLAAMDILKPNIAAIRKSLDRPAEQKEYVLKPDEKKPTENHPRVRKRLSMKIPR